MKVLFTDTETTGVDPNQHGVIQIASIMVIDKEPVDAFEIKCQLHPSKKFDESSSSLHGFSKEDIDSWMESKKAFDMYCKWLDKWINKYVKEERAYLAGYNVTFDSNFLWSWFLDHSKYGFGGYTNGKRLDVLDLLYLLDYQGKIKLDNYKLETVCKFFGVELKAHDAISDIYATYEIFKKLVK